MPFKDKLVVPVEVPAWGVISALVVGAFAFGTINNKLAVYDGWRLGGTANIKTERQVV